MRRDQLPHVRWTNFVTAVVALCVVIYGAGWFVGRMFGWW